MIKLILIRVNHLFRANVVYNLKERQKKKINSGLKIESLWRM